MSLVDLPEARPNGSAGPPIMLPPLPDGAAGKGATAAADAPATDPQAPPRAAATGVTWHVIVGFDGVSRRTLDTNAYATLKAEARRLVEGTTLSQYEIARRLDIRTATLSYWKRREHWIRPAGAPLPPRLATALPEGEKTEARRLRMIGRLYRVFERQTADLEARTVQPGATTDERGRTRAQRARQDT